MENNEICLVRPTLELKVQALAYREEHFQQGEKTICGSELFDKTESYEEWLVSVTQNTDPETVNECWVVTDTFFAIRKSDSKIIGIIDLRHTQNEFLKLRIQCTSFRKKKRLCVRNVAPDSSGGKRGWNERTAHFR